MIKHISKLIFFLLVTVIWNCETANKSENSQVSEKATGTSLDYFNLSKPEKFNMPESLLEISGIAFHDEHSDTVYAINDEEGKVFRLGWGVAKQFHSKFTKQGDYEDISIANGKIYVLKSTGVLYSFGFADIIYSEVDEVREEKYLLPKGEYEAMYADQFIDRLYVLCKKCEADYSWKTTTGYTIDLEDSTRTVNSFQIDVNDIKQFKGKVKDGFRPSGLAKDPLSGEWYVISAANKLLIVADKYWKIKDAFPLSGNVFNQPEGIAFDKVGNLYISNEGDDVSNGNILKFERRHP